MCLVTLPGKTNANAADNTTILSEDSTIQWRVVELNGKTDAENRAIVNAVPANETYVKYVMKTNWSTNQTVGLQRAKYVIFDFNGFTFSFTLSARTFAINADVFEIMDSSPQGTGKFSTVDNVSFGVNWVNHATVIMSGGTIVGQVGFNASRTTFIMRGGNITNRGGSIFFFGSAPTGNVFDFAPTSDVSATITSAGVYTSLGMKSGATGRYAVYGAKNDLLSGKYNYEFSQLTENLGSGQSVLERMSNPNYPNYLLYRESPTAEYRVITKL